MESFTAYVRKLEKPEKVLVKISNCVGEGYSGSTESVARYFIDKTGARHEVGLQGNMFTLVADPAQPQQTPVVPKKEESKLEDNQNQVIEKPDLKLIKNDTQPNDQEIVKSG